MYVILSARALNPALYIVTRASGMETEKKLKIAGANRVILPYYISGKRMAAWATKPVTSDFLDRVMHGEGIVVDGYCKILVKHVSRFKDYAGYKENGRS